MTRKADHSECNKQLLPVKDTLEILSGKWKILIILALGFGNKRFKELQRDVTGITARMLSKELKELEMNLLVNRTVYDSQPVTVEYSLTPYARSLDDVIRALHSWGSQHRKKILAAR